MSKQLRKVQLVSCCQLLSCLAVPSKTGCGGVSVVKQEGKGQLVLHCLAAALSPSALQYCPFGPASGEGGCLWFLGGVWVLSEVSCVLSGGDRIKTVRVRSV